MTKTEAKTALETSAKVAGGKPGTDDYDTGIIIDISDSMATVAWDSGVRTDEPISDLHLA